jgi:hypothetical protein
MDDCDDDIVPLPGRVVKSEDIGCLLDVPFLWKQTLRACCLYCTVLYCSLYANVHTMATDLLFTINFYSALASVEILFAEGILGCTD